MKLRPLNTIAILLASFGAIEAGRLGLKATQAVAESGHEASAEPAEGHENAPAEGTIEGIHTPKPSSCVPVDLAKEKGISAAEFNLLTNLQDRRIELDARENDILTREGILKTAEAIVQTKIDNLHQVEANIQKLLGQVDEAEQQRIAGLVRVYEKMKPKDAALVMQGLSDETLIAIASKMKDQSLALILAKMDTLRARQVTSLLAQIDDNQIKEAMTTPPAPNAANAANAPKNGQKVADNKLPPAQNPPLPSAQTPPTGTANPSAPNAPNTPNTPAPTAPAANQPNAANPVGANGAANSANANNKPAKSK